MRRPFRRTGAASEQRRGGPGEVEFAAMVSLEGRHELLDHALDGDRAEDLHVKITTRHLSEGGPPQRGGTIAQSGICGDAGGTAAMLTARTVHQAQATTARANPEVEPGESRRRTCFRDRRGREQVAQDVPPFHGCARSGVPPGRSHTSIHSAPTSVAMRSGAMRTAEFVEPAAGTTSSNARSEMSQ